MESSQRRGENNCRREFERFMLAILCCAREEGLDAIDEDQAAEDAQELFDAGEDRWFFTDESVFTRICARRSWMQIRLINHKYQEVIHLQADTSLSSCKFTLP